MTLHNETDRDHACLIVHGPDQPGLVAAVTALVTRNKGNIVFVCHSLGGVVVRYLLEVNETKFAEKDIGLVMIASPSYGSTWANRLEWLAKIYNQQLGIQLAWGSWSLRDLEHSPSERTEARQRRSASASRRGDRSAHHLSYAAQRR